MKKNDKQLTILNVSKIITLILVSILLIILIYSKVAPKKNDRTNTYLTWCKSAYGNPEEPNSYWTKKELIKCVKGWKKIEKELKK